MDLLHAAYVPAGRGPFPTVIAIHGWGASAMDLLGIAPYLQTTDRIVLCPQGTVEVPGPHSVQGYGWFPLTGGGPIDPTAFFAGAALLRGFVDDAIGRHPIDPRRLSILGFSQGGAMAYDLALDQPERYSALVALSSWLPAQIADRTKPSPALTELPTLVIHGENDPMVPVDRARESRERLEALGMQVAHGEYPMAHEISSDALRDLVGWLDQAPITRTSVEPV